MKKGEIIILMASLFILAVFINIFIVSASVSTSPNISCSDNSKPILDVNEIEIGNSRTVNGLGIGVIKTTESPFYKRISADLLVDTKKSVISNETYSETVELLIGNYTVSFVKANSTTATIDVNGESKDISLKQIESVKGVYVMISDISFVESGPVIKFIIGSQQITLSNDQNPAQKVKFNSKSFIVEISSASEIEALIKVSKCVNNEVNIEGQETIEEDEKPKYKKPTPEIKIPEPNESTVQVTVEEIRRRKQAVEASQTNQTIGDHIVIKQKGFLSQTFQKIWNWIKNLFKFKVKEKKLNNITKISNVTEMNNS